MLDLEPTSRVYVLKLAVFCDGSGASFLSDFKQRDEHFAVVDVLYLHHIHTLQEGLDVSMLWFVVDDSDFCATILVGTYPSAHYHYVHLSKWVKFCVLLSSVQVPIWCLEHPIKKPPLLAIAQYLEKFNAVFLTSRFLGNFNLSNPFHPFFLTVEEFL